MSEMIYGVDTTQPVTAMMVREALTQCFKEAHQAVLDLDDELAEWSSKEEREHFHNLQIDLIIKNAFTQAGVAYEQPTKEGLYKTVDALAQFAEAFRKHEIVEKHACEVKKLIDKIPD